MKTSDLALLERWVHQRDAEAFTELVSRHGNMVFGVARRILSDPSRAEDVSQEVFVELMRFADRSRRIRHSLTGWLHQTTVHRALDLIKSDNRRQDREQKFSEYQKESHESLDDVIFFVDEAIAELPEKLHAPLVAHFLEGRSHQDIAKALKLPRTTVTSRIARGIEEVRKNLKKRGLPIGASALASLLTVESAQAVPTTFSASLGKIALAKGMGVTSATTAITGGLLGMKISTAITVTVLAGLVLLFGSGILQKSDVSVDSSTPLPVDTLGTGATPVVETEQSIQINANETEPPKGICVSGKVLDSKGAPISGANVELWHVGMRKNRPIAVTTDDGSFLLSRLDPFPKVFLRTSFAGKRALPGGRAFDLPEDGVSGVEIVLYDTATIRGVVVDPAGRLVPDIPITAYWEDSEVLITEPGESDKTGTFEIKNLLPGKQRLALLPESYTRTDIADARVTLKEGEVLGGLRVVYRGDSPSIAGRVTDPDNLPLKNVFVQVLHKVCSPSVYTDNDGRYRLTRLPEEGPCRIWLELSGYENFHGLAETGRDDVNFTLTPHPIGTLSGRVIEATTGKPVCQFGLYLNPNTDSTQISWTDLAQYMVPFSDPEGRFSIPNIQADKGVLMGWSQGYVPKKVTFDQQPEMPNEEIVIALEPAGSIRGIVVDSLGNTVPNATVFGPMDLPTFAHYESNDRFHDALPLQHLNIAVTDKNGRFVLENLPLHSVQITAFHYDFGRATVNLTPSVAPTTEKRIVLKRNGTVECIVTMAGNPLPDRRVNLMHTSLQEHGGSATTDQNGRCILPNVPPGDVTVSVSTGDDWPFNPTGGRGMGPIRAIVESGETTKLSLDFPAATSLIQGIATYRGLPAQKTRLDLYINAENSHVQTNTQGEYRFLDVPAGEGYIRAMTQSANGSYLERTLHIVVKNDEVLTCDIDFSGSAVIMGEITGVSPEEIGQVLLLQGTVEIPDRRDNGLLDEVRPLIQGTHYFSQAGPYSITDVSAGTYTLLAYIYSASFTGLFDDARVAATVIQVGDGDEITMDFNME